MKKIYLILSLNLIGISGLSAHLNETIAQCVSRYGASTEEQTDSYNNKVLLFEKNGFDIFITFHDGKAGLIQYGKSKKDALGFGSPISDNEIDLILKANSPGPWAKLSDLSMADHWKTEDGNFSSEYRSVKPLLFVSTKEYDTWKAEAKKAKEIQNLKGM